VKGTPQYEEFDAFSLHDGVNDSAAVVASAEVPLHHFATRCHMKPCPAEMHENQPENVYKNDYFFTFFFPSGHKNRSFATSSYFRVFYNAEK